MLGLFTIAVTLGANLILYAGARLLWPGWEPNLGDWFWLISGVDMILAAMSMAAYRWLDAFYDSIFQPTKNSAQVELKIPAPLEVRLEVDSVIEARLRALLAKALEPSDK